MMETHEPAHAYMPLLLLTIAPKWSKLENQAYWSLSVGLPYEASSV